MGAVERSGAVLGRRDIQRAARTANSSGLRKHPLIARRGRWFAAALNLPTTARPKSHPGTCRAYDSRFAENLNVSTVNVRRGIDVHIRVISVIGSPWEKPSARISQLRPPERAQSILSAARRSCRSNSTSDGVNIRGDFEVAGIHPRQAFQAEPKALPTHFKSSTMLVSMPHHDLITICLADKRCPGQGVAYLRRRILRTALNHGCRCVSTTSGKSRSGPRCGFMTAQSV